MKYLAIFIFLCPLAAIAGQSYGNLPIAQLHEVIDGDTLNCHEKSQNLKSLILLRTQILRPHINQSIAKLTHVSDLDTPIERCGNVSGLNDHTPY